MIIKFRLPVLFNILGILMVSFFLWYRFLREKLPKDIPLDLTGMGFLIIIILCLGFCYNILRLLKPKQPNKITLVLLQIFTQIF